MGQFNTEQNGKENEICPALSPPLKPVKCYVMYKKEILSNLATNKNKTRSFTVPCLLATAA